MLEAEAAAAFDDLTRSGRDALLSGQAPYDWPNTFRTARLYSAVDYINAARARTLALHKMTETFAPFDVIVTPSEGEQLAATNLCGQPAVIVPNGIRGDDAPPSPSPGRWRRQQRGRPRHPGLHHLPRAALPGRQGRCPRPRLSAEDRLPPAASQAALPRDSSLSTTPKNS